MLDALGRLIWGKSPEVLGDSQTRSTAPLAVPDSDCRRLGNFFSDRGQLKMRCHLPFFRGTGSKHMHHRLLGA